MTFDLLQSEKRIASEGGDSSQISCSGQGTEAASLKYLPLHLSC